MPFSPGNALFEYRITRTLGQGAFGTVYLAQDTLLDRPVAIKELTAAAQADPVAFQRFLQEARAAGNLNHPNIITVYALKPTDDAVYLVMEYLPGGSLRGLLNERGRLPVEAAARIAADVCDGLAAAHAKGIVHRDIKPENILLTADGRAKVGDFGIAHVPRAAGSATLGGLTQTGFQPGTLVYMSPEQIRGEAVDGRSDVFQVGALLHEMLAGRHYLDIEALTRRAQETTGGNILRMQARLCDLLEEAICKHEPPAVRRLRPDVPGWLGATAAAMLARQTATRPTAKRSAGELRNNREATTKVKVEAEIVDCRNVPQPRQMLVELLALGEVAVWREGEGTDDLPGHDRRTLTQAPILAIWTAPPGPVELQNVLARVQPQQVYLFALDPGADGPNAFLRRLAGLVKYSLNTRNGRASVSALAVATGQREETVRLGLSWLAARGSICVAEEAGDVVLLMLGDGLPKTELKVLTASFEAALAETAAYRAYFRAAAAAETLRGNFDDAEAHYNLGLAYGEQGRTDEEIRECQMALRINPNYAEAHYNLGLAYGEQGRTDEEVREYQAALRTNPNYAEAHYNPGVIYGQQGCTDEEILEYRAALRINPDDADAHYNLGLTYKQQGRVDEAVREYQATLRINPDDAKAHLNLGVAYEEQGRTEGAIREYQAALRVNPYYVEVHYSLGRIYRQQERTDEAIREYQAALRIDPNLADAHVILGGIYGQQGRTNEAVCECQAALRINPNIAKAHLILGVTHEKEGQIDEAIYEYQAALRITPDAAIVHARLGALYGRQDRLVEARREAQQAPELGYEPARELLTLLG